MANDKHVAKLMHVAKLKAGVAVWHKWLKANPETILDLSAVDLRGADLNGVILQGADLREARLAHADLRNANLAGANLYAANLEGANLKGTYLMAAKLTQTDLRHADLTRTLLVNAIIASANLTDTNFSGAYLGRTVFGNVNLSTVRGLETVRHGGPSTVGIDVIYRSKGKIPGAFLRGAGVPDSFLTYMRSLVANPIEFYSCFISYSTVGSGLR